ncbi:MAG: hypothetical protein Roseis2KO_50830 [Roseivirga sp.]
MQQLKISILLLFALVSKVTAQEFLTPYNTFVSDRLAYVITQEGDSISGYLRSATEASGFIRRVSILDEFGNKRKFKAAQLQRFAIQPGAFAKIETVASNTSSLRRAIQTDFDEVLDREWLIYDSQEIPRRNGKTGLLQLLNPGFDKQIKVYHHPNGSKSMPISIGNVRVVGGEDRTFLVVKDNQKPEIVRKAKYRKAFAKLFGDDTDFIRNWQRGAKFRDFAQHVAVYSKLQASNSLSAQGN